MSPIRIPWRVIAKFEESFRYVPDKYIRTSPVNLKIDMVILVSCCSLCSSVSIYCWYLFIKMKSSDRFMRKKMFRLIFAQTQWYLYLSRFVRWIIWCILKLPLSQWFIESVIGGFIDIKTRGNSEVSILSSSFVTTVVEFTIIYTDLTLFYIVFFQYLLVLTKVSSTFLHIWYLKLNRYKL